jgi:hypothetical protein
VEEQHSVKSALRNQVSEKAREGKKGPTGLEFSSEVSLAALGLDVPTKGRAE